MAKEANNVICTQYKQQQKEKDILRQDEIYIQKREHIICQTNTCTTWIVVLMPL